MPCKTATIYTLSDPRTGIVYYVGCTVAPLQHRLRGHLWDATKPYINPDKGAWIRSLQSEGLEPCIAPVDEVPVGERIATEEWWIQRYMDMGAPLVNVHPKKATGRIPTCDRSEFPSVMRKWAIFRHGRKMGIDIPYDTYRAWADQGHEVTTCPARQIPDVLSKIFQGILH